MTPAGRSGARRLAIRFGRQADSVIQRGSPLYTGLLRRLADDLLAGGPAWRLLERRASEPAGWALPLRLMACLHRLALSGAAPALAAHYPSTGGDGDRDAAWVALVGVLEAQRDTLDRLLDAPLQTNEPGRSSALVTGLLAVAAATGKPLRLFELGASAGLNLNWPRYRFDAGLWSLGAADAAVRLPCAAWPAEPPRLDLLEARGCDAQPLDARSPDARLTLRSAVWADQLDRLAQLDAALAEARRHPPAVERADAADWLERTVGPRAGAATVVWHSVLEQYLDADRLARMRRTLSDLLSGAPPDAPVAWLSLERPPGRGAYGLAEVRLAVSPDADQHVLGHASYHGSAVRLAAQPDTGA